jgi:hypothetical protein
MGFNGIGGTELATEVRTSGCEIGCPLTMSFFFPIQTICRYFKGIINKESINKESSSDGGVPKPAKNKQVYSIRDVIKQKYQALIEDEIPYKSTDKQYISHYQRAVTNVHQNMTEGELEEAESIVELWNKNGALADVKLK